MNKQEIIERLSADEDRCKYCNSSTVSGGDIYCSASHSHDMDCDGKDFKLDYKIEEAISALEKQIPKKPIEEQGISPRCPYCDNANYLTNEDEEENNCCGNCGQAIDWRNEDE